MSSHTQSGMQQKAGTNFDGPKPVDAPLSLHAAAAPAGGGFAAMAARMAAAGGPVQQQPAAAKPKSAAVPAADSSSPASSAPAAGALAAGSCLTTSRSAAPRIVVLDSGAFISAGSVQLHATSAGFELLARLYRESSEAATAATEAGATVPAPIRFVTVAAVLAELKDERTRQMMAALPFQIEVMDVQAEAIKEVYRFAQLTGDAKTLSVTDVQIVALTYQLEKQYNGMNFLHAEPRRGKAMDAVAALGSNTTAAAVTAASKQQAAAGSTAADSASTAPATVAPPAAADSAALSSAPASTEDSEPQHEEHESDSDDAVEEEEKTNTAPDAGAAAAPTTTAADDNDGEGAWITPSNLHKHARPAAAASDAPLPIESAIACITTDYAMQNVLLQLGCRLLNLRGRSIRSIRSWMKKCHACDALSPDMSREFCDRCGHHSMIRVNVTVNAAGLVRFWHGTRHLNLRGTIYSIPRPRAGRHAANLKLSEDVIDERIRKGGGQGYGDKHAASKSSAQMFADSVEFGLGRTGPNTNQNVFGYGRKNPNAHSGHAQQKKKGRK